MSFFHKEISDEYWFNLSIYEQIANIGSETTRAFNMKKKDFSDYLWKSIDRMLDLIDLTIKGEKNIYRMRELCRLREVILDYILCNNSYEVPESFFDKYFVFFGLRARALNNNKK